jgi:16S rRNA G966 N2-methylase RsmD
VTSSRFVERSLLKAPFSKRVEASPHTAVYTMHKYFARRPWNVFRELIAHYSSADETILDPFCGGGVTVVESLKLRRRAVGVDVNPLATYITEMQTKPVGLDALQQAFLEVSNRVKKEIKQLYATRCIKCGGVAVSDWIEWSEHDARILRLKYDCPNCRATLEKTPDQGDNVRIREIDENFTAVVKQRALWYPQTSIPPGDKTSSLLNRHIITFHELFTRRNLLALAILLSEINQVQDAEVRKFLGFAFSSSLKWTSRQSHLRGDIVEGWAMHAYWIYPRSLEINVWNTFERRVNAIRRGKEYSNEQIGSFFRRARNFNELRTGTGSCLILNRTATHLPIPNESVDAIITDPPYGGNVNYGELSDFWYVWLNNGRIMEKKYEAVVNRTQHKTLQAYEKLLYGVFTECYRVLKPNRYLVSTFNSRDVRVVASFITAASRAGFKLVPKGLLYQKPIRPYTTTFHAMQIGAFVGDFMFTFQRKQKTRPRASAGHQGITRLKRELITFMDKAANGRITEPELRESAYRILIPFLAKKSQADPRACKEAVDFFETIMSKHEGEFRELRRTITERRRRTFSSLRQH